MSEAPRKKRLGKAKAVEFVGHVSPTTIDAYAKDRMGVYATEVNMDRSVPDLYDGLKPVQRRILWESHLQRGGFIKTARLSGGVIGRWHPHGDGSVDSACTGLVQQPTPPLAGSGNWGGLLDKAAAARYTNCKLSNYGETFFGSDYINKGVTDYVINYDDREYEPVSLPAMLPNVLLNGGSGIGVGVTTAIPTFTPESVIVLLKRILAGDELTVVDYAKTMKFHFKWGGTLVNTKDNRQAWLQLFKTGSASLQFQADMVVDRDSKAIDILGWPPGLSPTSFVNKVRAMKETDQVFNHKGDIGFRIEMRRDHNYTQFDAYLAKITKLATSRRSYKINVTHRRLVALPNGESDVHTRFLSVSIPKLIRMWLQDRLQVEKKSLTHRLERQQAAIDYSKLLIYAVSKLDLIFKALRAPDSNAFLVKHLKITKDQADQILDLKVRQLSKLDDEHLKAKLKEQEAFLKTLQGWFKKPRQKVSDDLDGVLKAIEKDRAFEASKEKKVDVQ